MSAFRGAERRQIVLYNCLPTTLAHFNTELEETLVRIGYEPVSRKAEFPIDGDFSRTKRAIGYLREIRSLARSDAMTISIWPGLGWADGLICHRSSSPLFSIMHDPEPIRPQAFMGPAVGRIAGKLNSANWICHTEIAARSAQKIARVDAAVALHPILTQKVSKTRIKTHERRTIAVIGQYKPTRDISILESIAAQANGEFSLRIVGRGWPRVKGWKTESRFVEEEELDNILDTTDVVLIPYRKYWQSGIAVRAVERGTAVVGESTEFLKMLLGTGYPGLVESGTTQSWVDAIERTTSYDQRAIHSTYQAAVDSSWIRALGD